MSAGEDFITSDQLKDELNQACTNTPNGSDIIQVDENLKEYKSIKSSRQGIKIIVNIFLCTYVCIIQYNKLEISQTSIYLLSI